MTKDLRVHIRTSPIVELIASVEQLRLSDHNIKYAPFLAKIKDGLLPSEIETLNKLTELTPFSLFELVKDLDDLEDTQSFILHFDDHLKNCSWKVEDSGKLKSIFKRIVMNISFKHLTSDLSFKYTNAILRLERLLEDHSPLQIAQALIGMHIRLLSNSESIYFCPSFFIGSEHNYVTLKNGILIVYDLETIRIDPTPIEEQLFHRLKVIAEPTRLEILHRLLTTPSYGKELADHLDRSTATISHHMEQLKLAGLVIEEQHQNRKTYHLDQDEFKSFFSLIKNYFSC